MPHGPAHDTGGSDKEGFRERLCILLTQVPRTAMHGMSAEVTMLQVKGRTEDDRGNHNLKGHK